MVEIDNRKAKLIAELEISRGEIRGAFRHCEAQLDIPSRLRRSVRGRPLLWLSSASLVGWLVSKLLLAGSSAAASKTDGLSQRSGDGEQSGGSVRRRVVEGVGLKLLKMGFEVAKPLLLEWATGAFALLANRAAQSSGGGTEHRRDAGE